MQEMDENGRINKGIIYYKDKALTKGHSITVEDHVYDKKIGNHV
jgi:hypothetical protein